MASDRRHRQYREIMKLKVLLERLPLHQKRKLLVAPLLPDLRKEHRTRSLPIRKGDTVLIRRGEFKRHEGKVTEVDVKKLRIYVEGVTRERADGTSVRIPIRPWNVIVAKLDLGDKWRRRILERKRGGGGRGG